MHGIVPTLFALAAVAMPPPVVLSAQQPKFDDTAALVRGNAQFGLDLYRLLQAQQGNLFLSPYSISSALAMTCGGARGATADEMAKVLHFDLPPDRLHPAFSVLARVLSTEGQAMPGCQLRIANALWSQNTLRFNPAFLALTRDHYRAGFYGVDFVGAPESARQTINDWVARQTENKIRNLLEPGSMTTQTRLVLTNAIYFLGKWDSPFEKQSTRVEAFHLAAGQTIQVPLMFQRGRLGYAQVPGLQLLEMPYAGSKTSMVVLLPDKAVGLAQLEKTLTARALADWLSRVSRQEVDVTLPSFKAEASFDLVSALAALGMRKVFGPDADLGGIGGVPGEAPLYVEKVVHKAFVDVNEGGTEAAAATAVVTLPGAAPGFVPPHPIPEFRADHPFLFLIRDVPTGSILFLGRLSDPR